MPEGKSFLSPSTYVPIGATALLMGTVLSLVWIQASWQSTIAIEARELAKEVQQLRLELRQIGENIRNAAEQSWSYADMQNYVQRMQDLNPTLNIPKPNELAREIRKIQ